MRHLDKRHVYLNLLNRDYEGEIKNFGDTVKVNQIGEVTIKDYEKFTIGCTNKMRIPMTTMTLFINSIFIFSLV